VTLVAVIRWPEPPLPVMQAEIQRLGYLGRYRYTALAPDGSSMVYADTAGLESGTQLWVKERASARGAPLPGTDGARDVVFAPDGEWIAYSVGTDIITRPLRGGGAVTQLEDVRGNVIAMSWMDDGTILCDVASGQCRLVRLSAAGKAPPDTLELNTPTGMVWVHGLPGSEGALIVTCPGGLCSETAALGVVDLRDGSTRTLLEGVSAGWYTPTGHLVCLLWNQEPRPERPVKSVSATGPIRILLRGGGLSSS
jgi:hypothetical protein